MTRHAPWILIAAFAGLTASGVALSAEEAPASPVLGFWESVETSRGGIGSALELRADGSLRWSVVVLVESEYRLDDGRLVMLDESGGEQEMPVTVADGEMEMTGPGGAEIHKTRFLDPTDGASPIVGDWSYDYFGQGQAFERYTEDGRMLFRLPMRTDAGTYRVEGDRLEVEAQGKTDTWTWRLDDDELVVVTGGEERRYRRVPSGAWYLQPPD
jgi:hypothetical protein